MTTRTRFSTLRTVGSVVVALFLLAAGGIGALAASARPRLSTALGAGSCILGCAAGLRGVVRSLDELPLALRRPWSVPYGELALSLDPLAALFLLIVFGLCLAAAVYGAAYLAHRRAVGPLWLFFNLLVACMALVVLADNGVLFLVAWEGMALSSYFLVTADDDRPSVREAGWLYLIATHTGTAFLLGLFAALAATTGSADFGAWREAAVAGPPAFAGILFVLAVLGFGTKAGLVPFHVWLPEAHPAAPSHVSAVMSGAMIKLGIYGLLRTLSFLGEPPPWWGVVLLALGIASAVVGVLFALIQEDVKRLLAYSSVENVGLIAIGLALGLLGRSHAIPALAALGMAAALLHTVNHAAFKGALFLGAGAVAHQTGTRDLDRLGGLLKRMPTTSACLLAGSAAIAALPPLNGFASEFLLYLASFRGLTGLPGAAALLPLAALVGLALSGGLAAACFLRLAGVSLLGRPRSEAAGTAREAAPAMQVAMLALAALCLVLGLFPGIPLRLVAAVAGGEAWTAGAPLLGPVPRLFLLLLLLVAGLVLARRALLAGREVGSSPVWDCGYERPTARMQYTGSSFAEPIREMFLPLLPLRRRVAPPEGLFPPFASFRSEVVRPFQERLYVPAFEAVRGGISRLRWLHHGRVQLYVLYIVVTLLLMLAWFAFSGAPR